MKDRVRALVVKGVSSINEELNYDHLNNPSDETPLFGGDQGIDSLSLVTLIVNLEGAVEKEFGKRVLLSDEKAMSARRSPYRSVGALVEFIEGKLGEQSNG